MKTKRVRWHSDMVYVPRLLLTMSFMFLESRTRKLALRRPCAASTWSRNSTPEGYRLSHADVFLYPLHEILQHISLKQHLFEQQNASPTTSLLLARFALIQHRGKQACNTHRHDAILVTIAHAPELISEELIVILKRACRDSIEGILMETLNTMIACKVHGAIELFR